MSLHVNYQKEFAESMRTDKTTRVGKKSTEQAQTLVAGTTPTHITIICLEHGGEKIGRGWVLEKKS